MVQPSRSGQVAKFGPCVIDFNRQLLFRSGILQELERKEFQILRLLLERRGESVTFDDFKQTVWPDVEIALGPALNTRISRIRRALGDGFYIVNERGKGYRFNAEVPLDFDGEVIDLAPPNKEPYGIDPLNAPNATQFPEDLPHARSGVGPVPIGNEANTSPSPRRRELLLYGVLSGASCFVGGLGFAAAKRFWNWKSPTNFRVQGRVLAVFDSDGSQLWQYTFDEPLVEVAYTGDRNRCLFEDVDGDGQIEVIFHYCPGLTQPNKKVLCFSSRGKVRWEFTPGRTVTDNFHRSFSPPFWPVDLRILPTKASRSKRLLVTSNHHWSFPMQIAVLDASSGRLLTEYWHRGHLLHSALSNGGFRYPRLFLAGVNDALEFKQATMIVFSSDEIDGASCDPKGRPYFGQLIT